MSSGMSHPRVRLTSDMALAIQRTFDDLGTPLIDQTFVVFDLETTGGSPEASQITEIGAVKVRAGEVIGEFQTLIDPLEPIPPAISVLTGITDHMVEGCPTIGEVLPAFLEWIGDAALVAHNASFDVGFLKAVCRRFFEPEPRNPVICTVRLAKRLVRDEVPNLKLSTLATALRSPHRPTHRALDDAKATVGVFHALLERCGAWGVQHTEELLWFQSVKGHPAYKKVSLLDPLPKARGVYLFLGPQDRVLYVGKAADLRSRVRSYFGDERRKIGELLREFERVEHHLCATDLDASVLEARMIRRFSPPYNRAQRGRGASWWLTLTDEPFPRLSRTRKPYPGSLGPLSSRQADTVKEAIEEALPIRTCTDRIRIKPTRTGACVRGQVGGCPSPCVEPSASVDAYLPIVEDAATTLTGDADGVLVSLASRIEALADKDLFEQAAATRDRLGTLVRALTVGRRLRTLAAAGTLRVAIGSNRLELHDGTLVAVDDTPLPHPPDDHHDEPKLIAGWLARNAHRVRILESSQPLASDLPGGSMLASWDARLRNLVAVS
jgi:DNA polymerase III subunit epsilon